MCYALSDPKWFSGVIQWEKAPGGRFLYVLEFAPCRRRLLSKWGFTLLLALSGLVFPVSALHSQDCIDYADYLHWIGGVDTPGSAYGVAVSGGYAYVADQHSGLQVIDISNPSSPEILAAVDTPGWANGVAALGSHAYVADMGSGLQVIDVSDPQSPDIIGTVFTNLAHAGVTVSGDYAYVVGGESRLQAIDGSNPSSPETVGSVHVPDVSESVAVFGDFAYVADRGSGLQVVDISDPSSPEIVGTADTPGDAEGVTVLGNYAYVADGYLGGLRVIDVSDPQSPTIVGSVETPDGYWAYDVAVAGDYAYLAISDADYPYEGSSLLVIDISDPTSPSIVGTVNTPNDCFAVAVAGSYAYVADGESGLQVIDISNPTVPVIVGSVNTPGSAREVAVAGSYAYVADGWSGLQVIDISDLQSPSIAGSRDTPGFAWGGVTVLEECTYVADGISGLQILPAQCEMTSITDDGSVAPSFPMAFSLSQNYPNPFNPTTSITYEIPVGSEEGVPMVLEVFNLRGQRVATLVDGVKTPGSYTVLWNGRDDSGRPLSSGTFLYRIEAGDFTSTRKMVILK